MLELNYFADVIVIIIINALAVILAFSTFLTDKRSAVNKLFAILSFSILLWVDFGYLGNRILPLSLLLTRLNVAIVAICFIIFYFFTLNFIGQKTKSRLLNIIIFCTGILFFLIASFSDLIVKDISLNNWGTELINGKLLLLFYVWVGALTLFVFYLLIKGFIRSGIDVRNRIAYFLIGFFIFAVINIIFNVALPVLGSTKFYKFGDYSVIFFLGFTAYAIIKHQMFNIKVITTEVTVVLLSIGLLIEVFISNSITEGALKGIVWVLATYGGYVLIKSVKVEIKQKEDLEKLSKKLDEANSHLEELDAAKDNFLSMAAHELNTPIAAISGYLSMIIEEKMAGEMNKKMEGYLKNIFSSSKRLATLVRALLNVSRIESNRVHLLYAESQIEDIIEQSVAEVKIKADEVGHKLTYEKPKTALPKTWFDVDRITEVVINIIGNAIKYTDPPGKITASAHTDGDKIVVAVEDNGRGIPKDKYDHIFEKFSQVNVMKDQVKGTGLGMFITKNLIELHKGKVWFKSSIDEKDHGTTFYFSLPILKEKPFDPNEGEGALFQTGKPHQERTGGPFDSAQGRQNERRKGFKASRANCHS